MVRKLDEQKERYSVELNDALQQYRELKANAAHDETKKTHIQPEQSAETRMKALYGKQYHSGLMRESQHDVSIMLGEDDAPRSLREQLSILRSHQRPDTQQAEERDTAR